jgi:glycosyltransferase involved in cell wall biosynthesis
MKALIIDPAVHSMGGHHYNAVQRLQAELGRLGVEAPCLGSAYADPRTIRDLACTPVFTRSVYGRSYADDFAGSVEETAGQLASAMRRLRPDLIVLPCCDQVLAAALARLPSIPVVLSWILYAPHHLLASDDAQAAPLHDEVRSAFGPLKAAAADLRICCETEAMAAFYRNLLGLDVGVMPGPGLPARARATRGATAEPVVSCIGFANRPKGYRLLPEALEFVLQRHADVRFRVHGVVEGSDDPDQTTFERLGRLGDRVSVHQKVLTPDEYLARLAEADLLLLPYDPAVYRTRGSGAFSDARATGVPIAAPRGCAFAQPAFAEGWGVEIKDYNGIGTGLAVLEALDRLPDLASRASLAAGQASDGLEGLLRSMTADRARPAGLFGRFRRRFA